MKKHIFTKGMLALFCMFVFGSITYGIVLSESSYSENEIQTIEENIRKAAMTCYSVEGYYPSSLSYLEENYGLIIDAKKVNVFYQSEGSNMFPDIMVSKKSK